MAAQTITDKQKVLTGATGIFTSILGLISGNPTAVGAGLSTTYSVLSDKTKTTIQQGTKIMTQAEIDYQASLDRLNAQKNGTFVMPSWLPFAAIAAIVLFIFKPFSRLRR